MNKERRARLNTIFASLVDIREHAVTVVSRWFRALSYAHAVQIIRTEYRNATTQRVSGEMTVKSRVVS